MSIDFAPERWEKIRADSAAWWAGELERPLLQITVGGRDPGRPEPQLPFENFTAFYDATVSAEAIVDRWDWQLSHSRYLGDAFPTIRPNFGPGDAAAFMGAELHLGREANTVWFAPSKTITIEQTRLEYRTDSPWLQRVAELATTACEFWQGQVLLGLTDLGGNLDLVSSFRPGEQLLFDVMDSPDEVKRLTWEGHQAWRQYYEFFQGLMQPLNPGYTDWAAMYSAVPYGMLQCDFSYMIGPAMFEEFVLPELQAACRYLPNTMYHLDGVGELPHLDLLLNLPELQGIQWIPGAGQPDFAHWPEIYQRIRAAGRLIQVYGGLEVLDALYEQLGSLQGVCYCGWSSSQEQAEAYIKRYGTD